MLDKFSEAIRGNLTKLERLKLVALVTIEVQSSHTAHMYMYMHVHACHMQFTCIGSQVSCFSPSKGAREGDHRQDAEEWLQHQTGL